MKIENLAFAVGVLLLIAVLNLPYGYYQFLRLVVSISSGILAFTFFEKESTGWVLGFGAIALLFNPMFPVYSDKETWIMIDLIVAGVFFVSGYQLKQYLK